MGRIDWYFQRSFSFCISFLKKKICIYIYIYIFFFFFFPRAAQGLPIPVPCGHFFEVWVSTENIYLEILPRDSKYGKESYGVPLFWNRYTMTKCDLWVQLHDPAWNSHKTTHTFWAWETFSELEMTWPPSHFRIIHISGL